MILMLVASRLLSTAAMSWQFVMVVHIFSLRRLSSERMSDVANHYL